MSAIQDFTTLLRTNRARTPIPPPVDSEVYRRALETLDISALFTPPTSVPASSAVPPPDLGMDVQPEPEVEPEIQPEIQPLEVQPEVHDQPEIQHTVEPIASVESHHPSAEVHAVAGESILVVERYVAEDRDDDTSGHAGIVESSRSSRIFPPPYTPPRTRPPEETRPSLFPYAGPVYSHDEWLVLVAAHHAGFRTYLLDVDSWRGSSMPREEYRYVPAFEMYPRRLREAIETGGMLRYESDPDPPIVEEDVISSEDEDVGGLQDEEEAMDDLFTEWFPPEPPTSNTLLLINFVQSS
ncbi:hypothetical protein R1sor_014823 [Riccia sorocarpa]|uniref:Uncharacterized protein n=1 Tax=Riccia sorocarpa TaxID=122646 RepID=A0ABD3HDC2_9MARC